MFIPIKIFENIVVSNVKPNSIVAISLGGLNPKTDSRKI